MPAVPDESFVAFPPEDLFDTTEERDQHLGPPGTRERSKKEQWLSEKATRPDRHIDDTENGRALASVTNKPVTKRRRASTKLTLPLVLSPPGLRIAPLTTLVNLWTHESLAILPGETLDDFFHPFLRDHFTNQTTRMDTRLIGVLTRVASRFSAPRIDVVSGYRSPKYNLMLRKKGREVARGSQHPEGTAVDFRVRGTPIKTVVNFVRSLRLGGVGYYPRSQFVHSDTGKVRYWTGT